VVSLESLFPNLLPGQYRITSPAEKHYNCIAWAAEDSRRWWWPGPITEEEYWPPGLSHEETLTTFQQAFTLLGFTVCENDVFEPEFEKVALFANSDGVPQHAARQLPNGRWTSKLGKREDIEHDLHALEGTAYGSVVLLLKRPIAAP
jgi:hypothetical protein